MISPERLEFLAGETLGQTIFRQLLDASRSRLDFLLLRTNELNEAVTGIIDCPYSGVSRTLSLQAMVLYLMVEVLRQDELRPI